LGRARLCAHIVTSRCCDPISSSNMSKLALQRSGPWCGRHLQPLPVRRVASSRGEFTAATRDVWPICGHTGVAFGSGWWFGDFDVESRVARRRSSPSDSRRRSRGLSRAAPRDWRPSITISVRRWGRPGQSLARRLLFPVSKDTLLRVGCSRAPDWRSTPHVVGIDDWAWKRALRYGTIVCDLKRRRIIDLLLDREVATVQAWHTDRPSTRTISHHRGGGCMPLIAEL